MQAMDVDMSSIPVSFTSYLDGPSVHLVELMFSILESPSPIVPHQLIRVRSPSFAHHTFCSLHVFVSQCLTG